MKTLFKICGIDFNITTAFPLYCIPLMQPRLAHYDKPGKGRIGIPAQALKRTGDNSSVKDKMSTCIVSPGYYRLR